MNEPTDSEENQNSRGPRRAEVEEANSPDIPQKKTCGLIMPISGIDDLTADHWVEVKSIIIAAVESIQEPKFNVKLVSEANDSGVIHSRIVRNVFNSDVIVCDVSAKNPNVMFELGMRLAFDKPTVIVKDDKTDYSFDTSPIEHIEYPRDLRYSRIEDFKKALAAKVESTYEASKDPNHTTFLKHFGPFRHPLYDEDRISQLEKDVAAAKVGSDLFLFHACT